jgi:hypothetical protein
VERQNRSIGLDTPFFQRSRISEPLTVQKIIGLRMGLAAQSRTPVRRFVRVRRACAWVNSAYRTSRTGTSNVWIPRMRMPS